MGTEEDSGFETIIIEGKEWADTTNSAPDAVESDLVDGSDDPGDVLENVIASPDISHPAEDTAESREPAASEAETVSAEEEQVNSDDQIEPTTEPDFDALRALTSLLVGGAIEGTSQLTRRLQAYQEAMRQEAAEFAAEGGETDPVAEDELVRLRYALVGLIFDVQSTFRRNVSLWAKVADRSARVTNRISQPVTNSFLFGPARRRYNRLIRRGEESLARWIADGRVEEAPSRQLARMTYVEIVDEFIDQLADNPKLQSVITEQSIGVASDMRDEVRERTVTADNLMEGLVRRILRRTPRAELPSPPPEVQRWAGLTIEEYREQQRNDETNETKDESS